MGSIYLTHTEARERRLRSDSACCSCYIFIYLRLSMKNIRCYVREHIMSEDGYRDDLRDLLLNNSQIDLVRYISTKDYITSSELSDKRKCTIQNASAKLKRLHLSGYLRRTSHDSETGGVEYRYYSDYE